MARIGREDEPITVVPDDPYEDVPGQVPLTEPVRRPEPALP